MKEIKIRYVLRNIITNNIEYKYYYLKQIEEGLNKLFDIDSYDIMSKDLYIGYKDKNGKEMYEYDYIKTNNYNKFYDDGAEGVVIWDDYEDGFRFNWNTLCKKNGEKYSRENKSIISSSSVYGSNKEEQIEIIGNIYEN